MLLINKIQYSHFMADKNYLKNTKDKTQTLKTNVALGSGLSKQNCDVMGDFCVHIRNQRIKINLKSLLSFLPNAETAAELPCKAS
jgi:hypothetical protein